MVILPDMEGNSAPPGGKPKVAREVRRESSDEKRPATRFGDECRDSKTDSIYEFDQGGNVLKSFGGGMFIWMYGGEPMPKRLQKYVRVRP